MLLGIMLLVENSYAALKSDNILWFVLCYLSSVSW